MDLKNDDKTPLADEDAVDVTILNLGELDWFVLDQSGERNISIKVRRLFEYQHSTFILAPFLAGIPIFGYRLITITDLLPHIQP